MMQRLTDAREGLAAACAEMKDAMHEMFVRDPAPGIGGHDGIGKTTDAYHAYCWQAEKLVEWADEFIRLFTSYGN